MASEVRRNRLAAWLLAVVLLALGAAAGVAADRLLLREPPRGGRVGPPPPEEMTRRLARDLDLSDAQARAVGEIVADRWRALGTLFERVDPEAETIRKQADERIRVLLDPEQQRRFDARVAEHERRRAQVRERLGRGGAAPPR